MMPLMRMCYKEGDGETGLQAALNYALMCISLGSPWVAYNKWTKTMNYLHMVSEHKQTFERAWQVWWAPTQACRDYRGTCGAMTSLAAHVPQQSLKV